MRNGSSVGSGTVLPAPKTVKQKKQPAKKEVFPTKGENARPLGKKGILCRKAKNSDWDAPLRVEFVIQGEFKHLALAMAEHDGKPLHKWLMETLREQVWCYVEYEVARGHTIQKTPIRGKSIG